MLRKILMLGVVVSCISIAHAEDKNIEEKKDVTFTGIETLVSIGALQAQDASGYYEGVMTPKRPKPIVTRPGIKLTCINTNPNSYLTGFFLDGVGKRATLYFPSGLQVKGRVSGRTFTGSSKVGGYTYRFALKGISPAQAKATITAVSKVAPGAVCEYPSKGTLYRY